MKQYKIVYMLGVGSIDAVNTRNEEMLNKYAKEGYRLACTDGRNFYLEKDVPDAFFGFDI